MHSHECPSWVTALELSLSDSNLHGLGSERRKASENLTHENSKAPQIGFVVVASSNQDFGSGVGWRATICSSFLTFDVLELFGESKIDQLYIILLVQEDVLKLDITMSDAHLM